MSKEVAARVATAATEIQEIPGIFERVRPSFLSLCTLCAIMSVVDTFNNCCMFSQDITSNDVPILGNK